MRHRVQTTNLAVKQPNVTWRLDRDEVSVRMRHPTPLVLISTGFCLVALGTLTYMGQR